MKVILLKDVKGQGKKGSVVEVSDGYAKNYLFPNGLAQTANSTSLNSLAVSKAAEERRRAEDKAAAEALVAKLKDITVKIPLKASENGKIFGALTSQMISDELAKMGIALDKKKIVMDDPIKLVGTYTLTVKPFAEVSGPLKIEVVGNVK